MTSGKTADNETEHEHGVVVETSRPETARPPLYQVVLLNDDYTPMEFVVVVLETFFNMARERATQIPRRAAVGVHHQHGDVHVEAGALRESALRLLTQLAHA